MIRCRRLFVIGSHSSGKKFDRRLSVDQQEVGV